MEKIYLDHAATTPLLPEVIAAMSSFLSNNFGNPSSIHSFGRQAKNYLEEARAQVASLINADPATIYFTSGGTEADNIAIIGAAQHACELGKGKHIITSAVEHHAVLDACEYLAAHGFELTVLPVDQFGQVAVDDLDAALRPDTVLVSIMHANNEVGTINPLKELADLSHAYGALFHVDAVQSVAKIAVDVKDLDIDLLSYSSHKINGPKGVGALYKRADLELDPLVHGGGQEKRLRPGTENLPGIVGFGAAAAIAAQNWQQEAQMLKGLRDYFVGQVLQNIEGSYLNGHLTMRLPHNANLSFDYVEGEALLLYLDLEGIACSSGSACSAGSTNASHVLRAMKLNKDRLNSAIRFSFGHGNTKDQLDYTVKILKQKTDLLRQANPFYKA